MFKRLYGVASSISFPLFKAGTRDFATSSDYTPASGDIYIKVGTGGSYSSYSQTNLTFETNGMWKLALGTSELSGDEVYIRIVDSATKLIDDAAFKLETFGNASALYAFDLDQATPNVNVATMTDDVITAGKFATGAITSTVIGTNAIGETELSTTAVAKIFETALTESYNADGAEATGAQILYGLFQFLTEATKSGDQYIIKKLDGTTTAYTLTLDSATQPSSKTRTA